MGIFKKVKKFKNIDEEIAYWEARRKKERELAEKKAKLRGLKYAGLKKLSSNLREGVKKAAKWAGDEPKKSKKKLESGEDYNKRFKKIFQ